MCEEWIAAERDVDFLLRGAGLGQFAGWAANTQVALTQDERAYLDASLAAERAQREEEELRQRRELETAQKLAETEAGRAAENALAARRLRRLALGLAVLLLAALGLTWFALNERNREVDVIFDSLGGAMSPASGDVCAHCGGLPIRA